MAKEDEIKKPAETTPAKPEANEGWNVAPTFGKNLALSQETYFDKDKKFTDTALRFKTGLLQLKHDDKTVLDATEMAMVDIKKDGTCVPKARTELTAPILETNKDNALKLKVSLQSRTTLNDLGNLGDIKKGGLSESARLPINFSGDIGKTNLSAYVIPNANWTTGSHKTSLGYTVGGQVKFKNGTAIYGERYKKPGTPSAFGAGLNIPLN